MKKIIIYTTSLFLLNAATKDKHEVSYGDKYFKYETENRMLNGNFTSYYPNGKIKAAGKYLNNQKVGKWKIYDTKGEKILKRTYTNSYNFKDDNGYTHQETRSESNLIVFENIKENDVVWSKRLWKDIPNTKENSIIYNEIDAINIIVSILLNDKNSLVVVSTNDDFREKISFPKNISKNDIVSLKIKEDSFYDKSRRFMETRIISLGLVQKDSTVYWVYYPSIREHLNIPINEKIRHQDYIQNIDDLFLYNHFYSEIYKESNIQDKTINELLSDTIQAEMQKTKIKLEIIDVEFLTLNQQFKN
ncbi:MAG: hypothetical protein ACLGGV_02620 [Bacteroidia bacterium]